MPIIRYERAKVNMGEASRTKGWMHYDTIETDTGAPGGKKEGVFHTSKVRPRR
jgi:hypothetical protein